MKILFIILDGLGDRPLKIFGGRTPLELAFTPNLDKLAREGICGLIKPVFFGPFPTSRDGHLALFGYNLKESLKRGPIEALGVGFQLKENDLAFRGNFASVDKKMRILDRRAGRISETKELISALNGFEIEKVKFFLKRGVSHRFALVLRGENLSEKISDGDPQKVGVFPLKIKPLDKSFSAYFSAKLINKFLEISHQILNEHPLNKKRKEKKLLPANYLLLRGAGIFKKMESFSKKWQKKACGIAGGAFYKGIIKALKMKLIPVSGATGRADTNLSGKVKRAISSLKKFDFCYLHIKALDIFSHDKDCLGEKRYLEKIDKAFSPLLKLKKTLIVITGDHLTPCLLGEHSKDLIPVLVYGKGKDKTKSFSEKECKKGSLGVIKANEFLKKIMIEN